MRHPAEDAGRLQVLMWIGIAFTEALAFIERRAGAVSAVLTDVQVPGKLDGFDLAVRISISWPKMLVLVTSGLDRPDSLLIPSVAFLPKPWRALDVITAMQNAADAA